MNNFKKDAYKDYSKYIVQETKNLLNIDSPSGYGKFVIDYLMKELDAIGVSAYQTTKGGVVAKLSGEK